MNNQVMIIVMLDNGKNIAMKRHGRVSQPCERHGLEHGHLTWPCENCTYFMKIKLTTWPSTWTCGMAVCTSQRVTWGKTWPVAQACLRVTRALGVLHGYSVESTSSKVSVINPLSHSVRVNKVYKRVPLEIQCVLFPANLMELLLGELDLILRID
ncbi:protease [Gossypium australe]|uniref:Protease n=1 Tax=Gossypium australe TaxID=47621 RepID=A0A5B6VKX0_9ROSI|nr:protease [Gossypium australe]